MQNVSTVQHDAIALNRDSYASSHTAVAWPAIFAGALVSIAVALILLFLGVALGAASISPWAYSGVSATTFTVATIIWLVLTQIVSSGLGGYLAGRLRSKWVSMDTDEVYFRDTAHGLLSWALATVITAFFLASAVSAIVGGGVKAAATVAAGGVAGASQAATEGVQQGVQDMTINGYFIDSLFRNSNGNATENNTRAEVARIVGLSITQGTLTPNDKTYLVDTIAASTGLSKEEATRRLNAVIAQLNAAKEKAKQAVDTARERTMQGSLYIFLVLLIGAFVASFTAAYGGRHRDTY